MAGGFSRLEVGFGECRTETGAGGVAEDDQSALNHGESPKGNDV